MQRSLSTVVGLIDIRTKDFDKGFDRFEIAEKTRAVKQTKSLLLIDYSSDLLWMCL